MAKVKSFLDSKLYIPIVFLISFGFWLVAYLSNHKIISEDIIRSSENITLITFGVVAAVLLILFKNTFYFIPWVIFVPFVFARPFDALTIPSCIFIGLGLMAVGLILNIIIYKPKLKFGQFFLGLFVLCIAFVLGGINVKTENYTLQILLTSLCVVAFLSIYCLIASSSKVNFDEVARLFTYLGIFLVLQLVVYFWIQEDVFNAFLNKGTNVGWGISNNIALMLLFTFPFTLYLSIINKNIKVVIYTVITYLQLIAIIITYSRGAIIALLIGIFLLIPFVIWKAKSKIIFGVSIVLLVVLSILFIQDFSVKRPEDYQRIVDIISKVNFDNFNGRTPIYEECIEALKEYPIFGKGVLSAFESNDSGVVVYEWGHSTILQTVRTMGLVGCIAMIIHLVQKYFVLLKRPTIWKIMVVASFGISGLYGLFDVSYYFINYMIPLILGMAMLESSFLPLGDDEYEIL